ncbi:MAG: hypothetical protein ACI8RD_009975 [Bacillariaceae sp.]|jgi:hypothetical protein
MKRIPEMESVMENLLRREEELIHSLMLYIRAKNNLAPGLKNISFKKDVLKELKIQFGTYENNGSDFVVETIVGKGGNVTAKRFKALQKRIEEGEASTTATAELSTINNYNNAASVLLTGFLL